MKRMQRRTALGCVLAGALTLASVVMPPAVHAFDKVWEIVRCSGVGVTERGLWDDVPGAGINNESALFWIVTNSAADERCTAVAAGEGVSTSAFPDMRVRVAVNDGATFTVQARSGSEFCLGGTVLASIVTTTTHDHSGFVVLTAAMPAGQNVGEVCIWITDNPNTVASERASALIDDLRIWNSGTSAIGWRERFTRAN